MWHRLRRSRSAVVAIAVLAGAAALILPGRNLPGLGTVWDIVGPIVLWMWPNGEFGYASDPVLGCYPSSFVGNVVVLVLFIPPAMVSIAAFELLRSHTRSGDYAQCRECGHILHGICEPRCPECGTVV